MLIAFMVSRLRRAIIPASLCIACIVPAVACQKVPLLAPTGSTITLTSSATTLPINGQTDIIAQVIEAAGTPPHSGTHITFTTNLGSVEPSEAETDTAGRVIVRFFAGTRSGTATITAISGGVAVAADRAVRIQIGAAAVGSVSVSASPATLPSTGGTSTITATVLDTGGNTLAGVPVTFAIDTGTGSTGAGSLSATSVPTNESGRAQTTVTTSRTTTVSATAGLSSTTTTGGNTTTTGPQTAKVTVNVNTTTAISVALPSGAPPPVAGQAVSFTLTYTVPSGTNPSPVIRVSVDWGDGQTQSYTGQPAAISHTYRSAGSYLVVVTGIDALGDTSTSTTSINVTNRPQPTVSLLTTTPSPQVGQAVTFTAVIQPAQGTTIQSVQLDFGDGTSGTLSGNATSFTHIYQNAGQYVVTAIATDSAGQTGSASIAIIVVPRSAPSVSIQVNANPASLATQQPVSFTATPGPLQTGVSVVQYDWNFGDGTTRTTSSGTTTHAYTLVGTYTVSVTATMSDGTRATSSIEERITP